MHLARIDHHAKLKVRDMSRVRSRLGQAFDCSRMPVLCNI